MAVALIPATTSVPTASPSSEHSHFLITVGGRRGRHPKIRRSPLIVETDEQVLFVIGKIVDRVSRRAWSGRLLSEQLDDIHFDKFQEDILKKGPEAKPVVDEGSRAGMGV